VTLPENVLQYDNSVSPTEMQRLLNMFTNNNPDIWSQGGLPLDTNPGSQLTRSPSRLQGLQPNPYDFGTQSSETWNPLALNGDPSASTSNEIASNSLGNYSNMAQNTNDLQSRVDSLEFDLNDLIHNLSELENFNWDLDDTSIHSQNPIAETDVGSGQTGVTGDVSNTAPLPQTGNGLLAPPDTGGARAKPLDPDLFGDLTPSSTEQTTGFVSELTPSQASSPSATEEPPPAKLSSDKKRKATKPTTRGTTKAQTPKRPRTSK